MEAAAKTSTDIPPRLSGEDFTLLQQAATSTSGEGVGIAAQALHNNVAQKGRVGECCKLAERQLLSGDQLKQSCGGVLEYVSKCAGQAALQRLDLLGNEPELFAALSAFADEMRPFEFGAYKERGFVNRSELSILPPMEIKVRDCTLRAEYVGAGHFALVFKISSPSGLRCALKIYYQRNAEDFSSGPWGETALGIYITAQRVSNMPHLCLANPAHGWVLTEFVDSDYQSPAPEGPTWRDLDLSAFDNAPGGPNEIALVDEQKMRVDYGHMATSESEKLYIQGELRSKLLELKGAEAHVNPQAFLQLYWSKPEYRKHLLFELACLAPEQRLPVLKQVFISAEAEFLPLQDYLLNGVISTDHTRKLFDLLMAHPNPKYRAQGIFDVRKLSKEDANYLGENWYIKPEFLPFLIYLGEKPFCGKRSALAVGSDFNLKGEAPASRRAR